MRGLTTEERELLESLCGPAGSGSRAGTRREYELLQSLELQRRVVRTTLWPTEIYFEITPAGRDALRVDVVARALQVAA